MDHLHEATVAFEPELVEKQPCLGHVRKTAPKEAASKSEPDSATSDAIVQFHKLVIETTPTFDSGMPTASKATADLGSDSDAPKTKKNASLVPNWLRGLQANESLVTFLQPTIKAVVQILTVDPIAGSHQRNLVVVVNFHPRICPSRNDNCFFCGLLSQVCLIMHVMLRLACGLVFKICP